MFLQVKLEKNIQRNFLKLPSETNQTEVLQENPHCLRSKELVKKSMHCQTRAPKIFGAQIFLKINILPYQTSYLKQ